MNLERVVARARALYPDAPAVILDLLEAKALFVVAMRGHNHAIRELRIAEDDLMQVDPNASALVHIFAANRARYLADVANAWGDLVLAFARILEHTKDAYARAKFKHEMLYEDRPFYQLPIGEQKT